VVPNNRLLGIMGDSHDLTDMVLSCVRVAKRMAKLHRDEYGGMTILHVGDTGIPFNPEFRHGQLSSLNQFLWDWNISILAIRGNHDCAELFDGTCEGRIIRLRDYTQIKWRDENILAVGGAASIDRYIREYNIWGETELPGDIQQLWWDKDELPPPIPEDLPQITKDWMVVSHDCPDVVYKSMSSTLSSPFMQQRLKAEGVLDKSNAWAQKSRDTLQELLGRGQPKNWYFGHYHQLMQVEIDSTLFHCITPNEIVSI
jgi:hypothetical protein